MPYSMTNVLQHQQTNLQHLYSLQNHSKSLNSDFGKDQSYLPKEVQQFVVEHQETKSTLYGKNNTDNDDATTLSSNNERTVVRTALDSDRLQVPNTSNNGINHVRYASLPNNINLNTNNIQVSVNSGNYATFNGIKRFKNSLTNASFQSRLRNSLQSQHKSLQQQIQFDTDPTSPTSVLVPTTAQPTVLLANRFSAWRSVIKSTLIYLNEIASIQDEIVRQQLRLAQSIQFPFFTVENSYQPTTTHDKVNQNFFLPLGNGSVQDLPTILICYHNSMAANASKASKELITEVIPRLNALKDDLLVKIKEIKSLQSDFKNNCLKEIEATKALLKTFKEAICDTKISSKPKVDPYLAKLTLNRQLKRQLSEENFLHEAFNNLQVSGRELENVVVMEIQNALTIYATLVGQQAQVVFDLLISKLDLGLLNIDPVFEWTNFISRDANFLGHDVAMRNFKEIKYKYQDDPFTFELKSGHLERRSKFLKNYTKGYYVLTATFLHEFRTSDRKNDIAPLNSFLLSDCAIKEYSNNKAEVKFTLHQKEVGLLSRGHNWTFKANSNKSMVEWFGMIKTISELKNRKEKLKFIKDQIRKNTGNLLTVKKSESLNDSNVETIDISKNIPSLVNIDTQTSSSFPDTPDSRNFSITKLLVEIPSDGHRTKV
ncbi:hypothetical protein KAFR_0J01470 [Kazachstania africana CBS 2517]|uniref:PH domain-containing protein n=1 Tax=Kazachstania africana (strain ATCC 22294 / BCRC 22015 / CBS 2517 / CECT 1963 / NBRC 1671 / NRRL Y-8276) TaxID=1071382 RepID=H2B0R3_KAZAF|nr:hypothetical protein KAFR_0J01470 [Kazachstania africana CBS 2517]CCF60213.1 hypothetical protein KAFR_0J01470 [Kazachstania africana CBS 2517]